MTCGLSGLPITGSTPAVLILLKMRQSLYDNSEESLGKYGSTYLCSNDGTFMRFIPFAFPLRGHYDEYGGIEIDDDDNTKALEEYFGLTIKQIVDIVTSGRKDDGYDDALSVVKESGVKDKYGEPKYQERYKELLSLSGMWVHRGFYEKLTESQTNEYFDKLDLGSPEVLEELGFVETGKDKSDKRYNRLFVKDSVTLKSDGTWLSSSIYSLGELVKHCAKKGVTLNTESFTNKETGKPKDAVEQIFDIVIPRTEKLGVDRESVSKRMKATEIPKERLQDMWEIVKNFIDDDDVDLPEEFDESNMELLQKGLDNLFIETLPSSISLSETERLIAYRLLAPGGYSSPRPNKLTQVYFRMAKEGKLRRDCVEFWRFNQYMYAMGKYYNVCGTSPQDGDHRKVERVLETALGIIKEEIAEHYEEED